MLNKIKELFKKPKPPKPPKSEPVAEKPKKIKKPRVKKEAPILSPKDLATQNGEPYVAVLSVDVDPNNINTGSFELDFNDKFVLNLIKSGYKIKETDTDNDIVDRWFQTVCRNIALEVAEQEWADPEKRNDSMRVIQTKDIGGGRSEVS